MKLTEKLKSIEPELKGDADTFKRCVSELYATVGSEKEKEIVTEFIESVLSGNTERIKDDFKILRTKAQLAEFDEVIPYSYIASNYFKKSKAWLSHRIRGYMVNGKRARFTNDELNTLNFALQDISKKIGSITV